MISRSSMFSFQALATISRICWRASRAGGGHGIAHAPGQAAGDGLPFVRAVVGVDRGRHAHPIDTARPARAAAIWAAMVNEPWPISCPPTLTVTVPSSLSATRALEPALGGMAGAFHIRAMPLPRRLVAARWAGLCGPSRSPRQPSPGIRSGRWGASSCRSPGCRPSGRS